MSFDEICHKHLYLGNYGSIKKEPCKTFGISHVVNCTRDLPPPNVKTVQFLRVPIDDSPNDKIGKHFEKMTRKIFDIIKTGGKVLVTCRAGISRSTTMVIAFLMRYHNMSLTDAHRLVRTQRPKVRPNDGFWKQLVEYERTLFNNSTVHFIRTKAGVIPSVYLVDTAVQMATEKQEAT
ncbi:dual specificity protein phosphatase 14-like [Bolinopsis microptera]|uniref:dual specificity protein phosphatase 14-like n=1 Tax=Bolinopsis microptera TaxID=2820187 RepID=UPI00307A703F